MHVVLSSLKFHQTRATSFASVPTQDNLHLIRPLGFEWDDKRLRRAGLDYRDFTNVTLHDTEQCQSELSDRRWFAMTTKGSRNFAEIAFEADDVVLYDPRRGLPDELLNQWPAERKLRIPMQPHTRSINLANSVAITLYEAWLSGATTAFFSEWSGQYLRLGSFAVAPDAFT